MREGKFVEQNHKKWQLFEQQLQSKSSDPQVLRKQLTEISEDLSYAGSFYRNRSIRVYLNGLAQQIYGRIYRSRPNVFSTLKGFFGYEIPRIVYNSRKEMLTAFLLLLLSVGIGAFSSWKDEGYARSILGDSYVQATLENIQKGNPMGIYKNQNEMDMFFSIAANNLKVGLLVFLAGLIASYGALVIMFRNGIMLGTFIYFFYARNLASEFNLTVWMHGTLEILTLVVETTAGMLLGRGLIMPGTLSRLRAFSLWARRGAMLFLATVPIILLAAFIESFLTRHTELPDWVRLLTIVASGVCMLLYFVYLPIRLFKGKPDTDLGGTETSEHRQFVFKVGEITDSSGHLIKSIQIILVNSGAFIKGVLLPGIAFTAVAGLFCMDNVIGHMVLPGESLKRTIVRAGNGHFEVLDQIRNNMGLLFNAQLPVMYVLMALFSGAVLFNALQIAAKTIGLVTRPLRAFRICTTYALLWNGVWFTGTSYAGLMYIALAPVCFSMAAYATLEPGGLHPLRFLFELLRNSVKGMAAILGYTLLALAFGLLFLYSPFSHLLQQMFSIHTYDGNNAYNTSLLILNTFMMLFLAGISICMASLQCALLALTVHETATAEHLTSEIKHLGKKGKAYGLETE